MKTQICRRAAPGVAPTFHGNQCPVHGSHFSAYFQTCRRAASNIAPTFHENRCPMHGRHTLAYFQTLPRIVILLAVVLFCCFPFTASAAYNFSDVKDTDWYAESVYRICKTSLMIGTSSDTFSPQNEITGAEAVTMLARVHASLTDGGTALSAMTDGVSPWYQGYADYCASQNLLTQGMTALLDTFMEIPISRGQLVYLLSALPDSVWTEQNTIPDNAIPDVPMGASYYDAIYRAYRCGITVGTDTDGTFHPDWQITRAEVAAMLLRIIASEMRLSVSLSAPQVCLYAADGTTVTVSSEDKAEYLAVGWREIPYDSTFSAEELLNDAILTPISTGYTPLDRMIDAVFADILTDDMTTYEKVAACYDYLVNNGSYGSSGVSGKYRAVYRNNPYSSPAPDCVVDRVSALAGDRGYEYYYTALQNHALEAYIVMYAAEMLDGMTGWCDHYSAAFAVMMRRLGLPCFPIYIGSKLGNDYKPHMMTIITVGGVDCVFDPQIEAVLVTNTGKNEHKRFAKPLADMTELYRNLDDLENCRVLFGSFSY